MWKLFAKYKGQSWEEIDEFDCAWEANRCMTEYILAYGSNFEFNLRKV